MIKAKIKRKTKGQGLQGVKAQISSAVRQGVEAAARDTARLAVQFAPGPVKLRRACSTTQKWFRGAATQSLEQDSMSITRASMMQSA